MEFLERIRSNIKLKPNTKLANKQNNDFLKNNLNKENLNLSNCPTAIQKSVINFI